MSGKALFSFDPTLFQDDENAVDDDMYEDADGAKEEGKEEETEAENKANIKKEAVEDKPMEAVD